MLPKQNLEEFVVDCELEAIDVFNISEYKVIRFLNYELKKDLEEITLLLLS